MSNKEIRIMTPISESVIADLEVGDRILISGKIYCGRDAVLPRITEMCAAGAELPDGIMLDGSVIFHTAVSPAGVGPTSSNKLEIESSMGVLSEAGVKLHLGKGALKSETVAKLDEYGAVYAIIPPVTALLGASTKSRKLVAFPELGMEAFHELEVEDYPAIIAVAHGKSIYDRG